ncbi:hypothetical protein COLO4_31058 [Corchorus olitorius]|uniref:Uncharacterized protein n=1 Tax=Corchorus olitorius TaxID=93759 RepID=A0A1R3H5T9_9ROSI|nr:hypothetical protein COLO4_31058 [Corchorus olitorius]
MVLAAAATAVAMVKFLKPNKAVTANTATVWLQKLRVIRKDYGRPLRT